MNHNKHYRKNVRCSQFLRVHSFATYAYSCHIFPLEFVVAFYSKTIKNAGSLYLKNKASLTCFRRFLKTEISFSLFPKKTRVHTYRIRIVYILIPPHDEKSIQIRRHPYKACVMLKIWCMMWTVGQTGQKNIRFQTKTDTWGRGPE